MFWKKKEVKQETPLRSDEYEIIFKKLLTLNAEVETVSLKIRNLDTELRSVRSKVNQHITKEVEQVENQTNEDNGGSFLNPFA